MDRPRAGFVPNFAGTHNNGGLRPALLPSPIPVQANSSIFAQPPPNLGNNYPQIASNAGQPPLPNFSALPVTMNPNTRPGAIRNNFSQPPPMRFPPTQYSVPSPNFSQQQYLASPCIGGSYDQNISTSFRPSAPQNFMPSHSLPMTHFPQPSPNMAMNFNNPPPQIRPQGETSNKPITNSNLNSDSRQHVISGQSHNRSGQNHNSSSGNQSNFPYQYPYASHGSRAHKGKNEDGRRSSDSREKRSNDVSYRRDNYPSERMRKDDSYNDSESGSYGRHSRENSLNRSAQSNFNYQRKDSGGSSNLHSNMHQRSREHLDGPSRKTSIDSNGSTNDSRRCSPTQRSSDNRIYPRSKRIQNENNSVHDIRHPEAKRQRLERSLSRRTPSLDNEITIQNGANRRSRSSSIGRTEQHRRSLSPERRPSRRRQQSIHRDSHGHSSSNNSRPKPDDMEEKKMNDYLKLSPDEIIDQEKKIWTRSSPADLYYERDMNNPVVLKATPRLQKLLDRFEDELIKRAGKARDKFPAYKPYRLSVRDVAAKCRSGKRCCGGPADKSDSEEDELDDSEDGTCDESDHDESDDQSKSVGLSSKGGTESKKDKPSNKRNIADKKSNHGHNKGKIKNELLDFMKNRQDQAYRLHPELWDNQPGELNDGPACRCSLKARKFGIRHGIYQGEDSSTERKPLDPLSNNGDRLYHYRVTISPPTNFLVKTPTAIPHDGHEFIFEGFSLFTTVPLKTTELPVCNIVRFSIKYSVLYFQEKMPDNITVRELELFHKYFFSELLELHDFDLGSNSHQFLFMPRFVRDLSENGKEILSMNEVMSFLMRCGTKKLMDEMDLLSMTKMPFREWDSFVDKVRGQLVTYPGMKPSTLRVDQLDREQLNPDTIQYPLVVHSGNSPPQLCYAGNGDYMKAWRDSVKFRHLLANMPKVKDTDRQKLADMEEKLNEIRSNIRTKRGVTVELSAENFFKTGLMTDIVQHGLLLPSLVSHLRFHASLDYFENAIEYKFKNRQLLQLAMTHPSYKENFGTNPDHARNALSHCGIRQVEYGDKKVHTAGTRKRGINMLISIMSKFGRQKETESKVGHNERLEFLGDAVVEFITSVHLFHMFPDLEEGGLATYRAALVQNQHLAILAERLGLEKYMLYAHGNDLCHDAELRHAMANCFEALMGAIYLDSGINEADRIFSNALFGQGSEDEKSLHETWVAIPLHPLQKQEMNGDRHWISSYNLLQKLITFEESTGLEFTHIRLLARSFSDRSLSNCNLTMGSNQRLEFLGDTVLQLVTSDYLYRHFPEHHEGHLSLLRSSMVNNRTQAIVCDDLGIPNYAMFSNPRKELKMKDRADLLEALIGAIYVDKDLDYCRTFAEVCFFPRLYQFIINQDWNDPKSKLQQCCLTLRTMDSGEPDIPIYKVIACKGPTNTRVYTVAVYFRGQRLAHADGPSIQAAEMNAAKYALQDNSHLFPHLQHQKRIMERSFMNQGIVMKKLVWEEEVRNKRRQMGLDEIHQECSIRNDEKIRKALEKKHKKKKERVEEEGIQANNDLVEGDDESNQDKNIEPEPEKEIKREDSVDMEQKSHRISGHEMKDCPKRLDTSSSKIVNEMHASYDYVKNRHHDRKRRNDFQPNSSQYAFKKQNQDDNTKDKSVRERKNQPHRPNLDQRVYRQNSNRTSHFANRNVKDRNDFSRYSPKANSVVAYDNPEGTTQPVTTSQGKVANGSFEASKNSKTNNPMINSDKETRKMPLHDGNKEEGELTDDDSEANLNKVNVASFEDYAEPISSPE